MIKTEARVSGRVEHVPMQVWWQDHSTIGSVSGRVVQGKLSGQGEG